MMRDSFDLLRALKKAGYLQTLRDPLWWPHSGTEKVLIGAILTQQSKWEKVELSLENLAKIECDTIETLATAPLETIKEAILPSGFYNMKSRYLQSLSRNILSKYGNFDTFCRKTDREWLLSQKGIGMESADAILCYGAYRPVMVVDSYTKRLVSALGYEERSYMKLQQWLQEGIDAHNEEIEQLYGRAISRHELFARFHGKIVEFCKEHIRRPETIPSLLQLHE